MNANTIRVTTVNSAEQARRIDEVIACRAYEIFESRGGAGWHELEDWRQAETDVRSKLCFGRTSSNDSLVVSCDVAGFKEGSVEIWVAPRQMTICGKLLRHKEQVSSSAHAYQGTVIRVIALSAEIEPSRATLHLKRNFMEIHLPLVRTKQEVRVRAHAA
jgi:hypothetical protein